MTTAKLQDVWIDGRMDVTVIPPWRANEAETGRK
jgi:hypothetical protein